MPLDDVAHLFRDRTHPRQLCTREELDALKGRLDDPLLASMWARLQQKCRNYTDPDSEHYLDLTQYDANALFQRPGQFQLRRILLELAFAWSLEPREEWLKPCREMILRFAREVFATDHGKEGYTHWRSPLGMHALGHGFGIAYDLLYDEFSPAERDEITGFVKDYFLDYLRGQTLSAAKWNSPGFNKTLAAMAVTLELTLLIREELAEDEFEWLLAETTRGILGYMCESVDDDGMPFEGPGYGGHCIGHAHGAAEMLRRAGRPELFLDPHFRSACYALLAQVQPGQTTTFSLGDSNGDANITEHLLLTARYWRDGVLQWMYLNTIARADHPPGQFADHYNIWHACLPQQMLWYDPSLKPVSPEAAGTPSSSYFRGTETVHLRTGWEADSTLVQVTASGHRESAAAHLPGNVGNINLFCCGKEFLQQLPYGYSRSRHHSCHLSNGEDQQMHGGGNSVWGGRMHDHAFGEFADYCCVDFALASQNRWALRHVLLVKHSDPFLIVFDDVNKESNWYTYDVLWQLGRDMQVETSASGATVTGKDGACDFFFLTHAETDFPKPHAMEVVREDEDYEPWAGQSRTEQRLRVHLEGYTGNLTTLIVPRRKDAPTPVFERLEANPPGISCRLLRDGCEYLFAAAPMNRFLRAGDALAGQGCLGLAATRQGATEGFALIDGYTLSHEGNDLVPRLPRAGAVIS